MGQREKQTVCNNCTGDGYDLEPLRCHGCCQTHQSSKKHSPEENLFNNWSAESSQRYHKGKGRSMACPGQFCDRCVEVLEMRAKWQIHQTNHDLRTNADPYPYEVNRPKC